MNCHPMQRTLKVTVNGDFENEDVLHMTSALADLGKARNTLFSVSGNSVPAVALFTVETVHAASDVERLLASQRGVQRVHVHVEANNAK